MAIVCGAAPPHAMAMPLGRLTPSTRWPSPSLLASTSFRLRDNTCGRVTNVDIAVGRRP